MLLVARVAGGPCCWWLELDVTLDCVGFSCGIMVSMKLLNYKGGIIADHQPKLMVSATEHVPVTTTPACDVDSMSQEDRRAYSPASRVQLLTL